MTSARTDELARNPRRRRGDSVRINGDYQHRARVSGFVVQRFWHANKEHMVRRMCPPRPTDRVLNVGCGSGVLANALAADGCRVTGVDSNPHAIDYARRVFSRPNLDFHLGQAEDLPVEPRSVDRVYCFNVIEHLYQEQGHAFLARLRDVLVPGGSVMLATPNFGGLWPILEWSLDALRLVPRLRGVQHVSKWTDNTVRAALGAAGLQVRATGTFSTVAPFVSPISWALAERVAELEAQWNLAFGAILFAVAEAP